LEPALGLNGLNGPRTGSWGLNGLNDLNWLPLSEVVSTDSRENWQLGGFVLAEIKPGLIALKRSILRTKLSEV
jgi:hypothetical protein